MTVVRALVIWFVMVSVLFLVAGALGMLSTYEVLLVLVVSIVLTYFALRAWDSSRAPVGRGERRASSPRRFG